MQVMKNAWGKSVSIDLFNCDHQLISQKEPILSFISQVIPLIGMKAHGPTYIDRFAEGALEGWSAMQFIETSSITLHADEIENRCFIDIFTCKDFNEQQAIDFAKASFKAESVRVNSLTR